jgi:hypothetical protein
MVEPSALENLLSKPGPLFEGCGSIQDESAANSIECPEPLGSTKAGYICADHTVIIIFRLQTIGGPYIPIESYGYSATCPRIDPNRSMSAKVKITGPNLLAP